MRARAAGAFFNVQAGDDAAFDLGNAGFDERQGLRDIDAGNMGIETHSARLPDLHISVVAVLVALDLRTGARHLEDEVETRIAAAAPNQPCPHPGKHNEVAFISQRLRLPPECEVLDDQVACSRGEQRSVVIAEDVDVAEANQVLLIEGDVQRTRVDAAIIAPRREIDPLGAAIERGLNGSAIVGKRGVRAEIGDADTEIFDHILHRARLGAVEGCGIGDPLAAAGLQELTAQRWIRARPRRHDRTAVEQEGNELADALSGGRQHDPLLAEGQADGAKDAVAQPDIAERGTICRLIDRFGEPSGSVLEFNLLGEEGIEPDEKLGPRCRCDGKGHATAAARRQSNRVARRDGFGTVGATQHDFDLGRARRGEGEGENEGRPVREKRAAEGIRRLDSHLIHPQVAVQLG